MINIETPTLGSQVTGLQMNGVCYPLEGLRRITFEVPTKDLITLTLEYFPKTNDSKESKQ